MPILHCVPAEQQRPACHTQLDRIVTYCWVSCRASRNRGLGLALHWLLYTEWEDPVFGPRVQRTHVAFQAAAEAAQVRWNW